MLFAKLIRPVQTLGFFVMISSGCTFHSVPKDENDVQRLMQELHSSDLTLRRESAFSLSRLAVAQPGLLGQYKTTFAIALSDPDEITRLFVAHTLSTMGDDSDEVAKVYLDAISSTNNWCRSQSCSGPRNKPELLQKCEVALLKGLEDTDSIVVAEALYSLNSTKSDMKSEFSNRAIQALVRFHNIPSIQKESLLLLQRSYGIDKEHVLQQIKAAKIDSSLESLREDTVRILDSPRQHE